MGETSLKFGPEWLRALSHGGASSPPSSPLPGKFKLAGFRYGREDMLGLFANDLPPPDDCDNLGGLYVEDLQLPLTFLPLNAEEQRMFARGVNSEAVLRGTGRLPTNGIGRGRGVSVERGRGRGRGGNGAPYYSRGISYDEDGEGRGHIRDAGPPGLSGRGKLYDRSQSVNEPRGWNDRGIPERAINPNLEDKGIGIVSPRKEPNRANNENWRSRGAIEGGDRWGGLSSNRNEKWGPRTTWRERENGPEGEWDETKGHPNTGGYSRGVRSWDAEREKDMLRRQWEEDHLPEWATESTDDKGGSFDASGAFHAPGYSDEEDSGLRGDNDNIRHVEVMHPPAIPELSKEIITSAETNERNILTELKHKLSKEENKHAENYHKEANLAEQAIKNYSLLSNGNISEREQAEFVRIHKPDGFRLPNEVRKKEKVVEDLEHMQIEADDLVAKLVEDDEPKMVTNNIKTHQSNIPPPAGFNCHNNQLAPEDQWFYTDPQGEIQGPFSSEDMAAWYEVGYFKSNLLLRRQCDDKFAQLGDLMRVFGRMPFLPGPAVPPLKVSELLAQKALAHRERLELQQAYQLKTQLYQQQSSVRQHQILQQLQSLEEWSNLTSSQQQQLFMQHMMSLPPLQPPTIPSALQDLVPPTTTVSMMTIPSSVLSAKSSQPSMRVSPVPVGGQPQDPIQILMAQMQSQAAAPISSGGSSLDVPVQMSAPSTPCVASEGPLQKLLSQLQRGPSSQAALPTVTHSVVKPLPSQPVPEQIDPIKAFLTKLSKRQPSSVDSAQEEHNRREEENRQEVERDIYEEQRRQKEEKEEELRYLEKLQEERRLQQLEEEKSLREHERQLQLELEEKRKQDELERRLEQKRKAEEAKLLDEEAKREQKIKKKQEEEKRRKEEAKKKEEAERRESKRKEEERLAEEKRKKEEKKQEEERKRKEKQAQHQEQMRKNALEEERKRMNKVENAAKKVNEDQKRAKNLKQTQAAWNSKTAQEALSTPSLIEIQKAQEIRDKKEKDAETKDQKRLQEVTRRAEEKRQKEQNQGWAAATHPNKRVHLAQPPVKSLLEIQQEEEKELKKRLKKEQAERALAVNHHHALHSSGVWASATQALSWANRASSTGGIVPQSMAAMTGLPCGKEWADIAQAGSANSNFNGENSGGFWENPGGKVAKSHSTTNVSNTAMPSKNMSQASVKQNLAVNSKLTKKKNKDENVKKIFSDNFKSDDNFGHWCKSALSTMKVNASIDIPTFVGFLADVDSPCDVHDYIRSYLGESKEVRTFAKDYLEKRSKAKNALKQRRNDDDILAPAPAVNPTNNQEFQEIKVKVKKTKKKMQKFDNNLLGFKLPVQEQPPELK